MLLKYVHFLQKFRWPLAICFLALFVFSLFEAKHLKLRSDFKELLPENFQSVKDLNRIIDRVGSTNSLIIAIESDNPKNSIRFGEDLVAKLKTYPPEDINRIEYNAAAAKKFFQDNKYLYLNLDDIKDMHDQLDRKIQKEKLKKAGLFIDFGDETNDEKNSPLADLEDKYKSKTSRYDHYIDGYFFDEQEKLMAIVIRPPGASTGIDFSKKLITKVNASIDELNPQSYDPSMKVGLTGKVKRSLFEYQGLIDDIVSTAGLCIFLVSLVVLIYYRKIRMVVLMAWATFNGTFWIFAIASLKIGYLTSQTAFLGSIIIGNGINASLILMARYLEERKKGIIPVAALEIAIPATMIGTLASALTTSVAFGVLMLTDVRGFSHFGFIGGLGIFFCWLAAYTVLPVGLYISEEIWPTIKGITKFSDFSLMSPLNIALGRWSKTITYIGLAIGFICIPLLINFIPNSVEYDFTKLRMKLKGTEAKAEFNLNARTKKIFGGSLTPAILVTDSVDEVKPLCDEIMRKNALDDPKKQVVDSCKSLITYVPDDQDAKNTELTKIRSLLTANTFKFLTDKQKQQIEDFKKDFSPRHVSLADIPENIIANFREKNGDVGKIVFVYPSDKAPLWNGKNLIHFSEIIRNNTLPNGKVITGSGDSAIFADLLSSVINDGLKLTILAFFAVCIVVILVFREKNASLFVLGTLSFGVLISGGLIALFKIKINFFNFIAIPTTFGIGVDYACNIYQRYKLEGKGSMPKVIKTTGGAVTLCSLTTIIGYFTLVIAQNQALVSFGWIGLIGEIACLFSALIFTPALVTWKDQNNTCRS